MLFLLTKFWIKTEITSDSKEIRSSIEQDLNWSFIWPQINGTNIPSSIFISKINSESSVSMACDNTIVDILFDFSLFVFLLLW